MRTLDALIGEPVIGAVLFAIFLMAIFWLIVTRNRATQLLWYVLTIGMCWLFLADFPACFEWLKHYDRSYPAMGTLHLIANLPFGAPILWIGAASLMLSGIFNLGALLISIARSTDNAT